MRTALLRNWEMKGLAVVIALVVWFFVAGGDRSRMVVATAVEYVGLADDVVLVSDTPERVDVHLEVARWAAGRVTPDALRVRVNLASVREGDNVVVLSADDVAAPAGVMVTRLTPARLRVAVARAVQATLRVVPQISGEPAPGYAAARVVVDPPAVAVKGPQSTIGGRQTVETVPVDVSGSRAPVTQTVGLMLPEFAYPTRGGSVQVTVDIRSTKTR